MAVGSNTPIFGTLIYKFQQVRVARPTIEYAMSHIPLKEKE